MGLFPLSDILQGTKRFFVGLQGLKSDGTTMENLKTNDTGALKVSAELTGSSVTNGLQTRETWTPIAITDTAVGNDKTFTVPANTEYEILSIGISLTTTATVGDRKIHASFSTSDAGSRLARGSAGKVIPANTAYAYFTFAPGLPLESTSLYGDHLTVPLAKIYLPAGYKIRVYDVSNITNTDTLRVYIQIKQRTVA